MSSSHKHIHFTDVNNNNNNNNNSRYAGQLEFFVGAKLYCPHALASGQRIRYYGGDAAGVLLNSVIYAVSVPLIAVV